MDWDFTNVFAELKKRNLFGIAEAQLDEARANLYHVNILLAGQTGVGKSSLVNGVFGEDLAATGRGDPVTQEITWYSSPTSSLRLIDTKGLELEKYKETLKQLKQQLDISKKAEKLEDKIHIAWVCILNGSNRVQDGEKELVKLCRAYGVPVIVVLTQVHDDDDAYASEVHERIPDAKVVVKTLAHEKKTEQVRSDHTV